MKYNDFIKETIMDFSSIEFKNIKALLTLESIFNFPFWRIIGLISIFFLKNYVII